MKARRTLGSAFVAFSLGLLAVAQPATALERPGWAIVDSPTIPAGQLNAVAAISSKDVWAVGDDLLAEHWDGVTWSVVPTQRPTGPGDGNLTAVGGSATDDVWALGRWAHYGGHYHTFAEHWNGHAWRIVASKTPDKDGDYFSGVAVFGTKAVWGIGNSFDGSTLAERWDGTSWKVVTTPDANPRNLNVLFAVAGSSGRNVWAVGNYTAKGGVIKALVEHWDGTAWKVVNAPSPDPIVNSLGGVTAIAPGDVWAVGYDGLGDEEIDGLALHWNGSTWAQVAMPTPPGINVPRFAAVAASSPDSVWAVGTGQGNQNVIEYWDGTAWSVWPAPNPSFPQQDFLSGVTARPNGNAWAVGASSPTADFTPDIFRFENSVPGTSSISLDALREIQLGESIQVSGTLLFSQGEGSAGSTVDLVRSDPDGSSTPIGSATVDFNGQFSLMDIPPAAGAVTYTATFGGDAFHDGSSATGDLVVDPAP